jgi:hypothetical protein
MEDILSFWDFFGKRKSVKNWEKVYFWGDSAPLGVKPPRQGWRGETNEGEAKRILYGG